MVEKDAARPQETAHGAEVLRQILLAHVLEHADAGNLVEGMRDAIRLAIVPQFDGATLRQAGLLNPALGYLLLLPAQRNALRVRVIVAGGMQHQAAPATADVQKTFERPEAQFAADQLEFLLLGQVEWILGVAKVGARVSERRA